MGQRSYSVLRRRTAQLTYDFRRELASVDAVTITEDATEGLLIVSDNLSYVPIVLREYDDPSKVVGVIAVGSTEVVEIGRGLLGMLSQTLKVLVAAGLPPLEGGTVDRS